MKSSYTMPEILDSTKLIKLAIVMLQNCLDQERKLPEICMEVIDDLLMQN